MADLVYQQKPSLFELSSAVLPLLLFFEELYERWPRDTGNNTNTFTFSCRFHVMPKITYDLYVTMPYALREHVWFVRKTKLYMLCVAGTCVWLYRAISEAREICFQVPVILYAWLHPCNFRRTPRIAIFRRLSHFPGDWELTRLFCSYWDL
jgi:hypothetical protein